MSELSDSLAIIETIESRLNKWRTWFPSENSCVDITRADLLLLVKFAKKSIRDAEGRTTINMSRLDLGILEDGYHYFHAKGYGAFTAQNLRDIANELDYMNEDIGDTRDE